MRLPSQLITLVDNFVAENTEGYTSTSEVVRTAIREWLQQHDPKMHRSKK